MLIPGPLDARLQGHPPQAGHHTHTASSPPGLAAMGAPPAAAAGGGGGGGAAEALLSGPLATLSYSVEFTHPQVSRDTCGFICVHLM